MTLSLSGITKRFKENETHFLRAFPAFKSTKYGELIERIRLAYKQRKEK